MNRKHLYWIVVVLMYILSVATITHRNHDMEVAIVCSILSAFPGYLMAAAIDGYLTSTYPGFLYTPYEDRVEMVLKRIEKREAEAEKALGILENDLLNPCSSLSWKYKLINEFFYKHPELIVRLKQSERYKTWRTDVIDWAKCNLYRLKSFYFNDGIFSYVYDSKAKSDGLVDLNTKFGYPQEPDSEIMCDIEFKNKRLPRNYFGSPGLVWESDFSYIDGEVELECLRMSRGGVDFNQLAASEILNHKICTSLTESGIDTA